MKEIAVQKRGLALYPASAKDEDVLREYRDNQLLRAKLTGFKKQRSYQQLKLFFACCGTIANNTDDPKWATKNQVAFQCKVALHFVDPSLIAVRPDGTVQFHYRSISFKNLSHMEACNFFNRAFEIMAKKIGITVDELLKNTER